MQSLKRPQVAYEWALDLGSQSGVKLLVKIEMLDIQGRVVDVALNERKAAGTYEKGFEKTVMRSRGIYFVRLTAGKTSAIRKVLFQ